MQTDVRVQLAEARLSEELYRSIRESDSICPREADDALNDASRAVVEAMKRAHGEAWLVRINTYDEETKHLVKAPSEDTLCNFSGDAVIPRFDEALQHLLQARKNAEYKGVAADKYRVDQINDRIKELGGAFLFWS